jgi:hypothetical protein
MEASNIISIQSGLMLKIENEIMEPKTIDIAPIQRMPRPGSIFEKYTIHNPEKDIKPIKKANQNSALTKTEVIDELFLKA